MSRILYTFITSSWTKIQNIKVRHKKLIIPPHLLINKRYICNVRWILFLLIKNLIWGNLLLDFSLSIVTISSPWETQFNWSTEVCKSVDVHFPSKMENLMRFTCLFHIESPVLRCRRYSIAKSTPLFSYIFFLCCCFTFLLRWHLLSASSSSCISLMRIFALCSIYSLFRNPRSR